MADPYEWTEGEHNGRFRWRRDPVLFPLFEKNPDAAEFYSSFTWDGKDYGQVFYPAIWQVQRWDAVKSDWGPISNCMELPGMD